MDGAKFERYMVEALTELIEQKGLRHKPVALLAWPDHGDPATKWRKIRNGSEPRGLRVCDAYDMAAAIGVSFLEVCSMATEKLRRNLRDTEKNQVAS